MLPPRLIRRLVLAPLVVVIALAFIVLSPFLALLALVFGLAARSRPGRMRSLRLTCFALIWFVAETAALFMLLGLWIVAGFGGRLRTEPYQSRHYAVIRWFLDVMYDGAARTYGLRVEVDEPELTPEERLARLGRPIIVLSRHAGPGDSFLLIHELLSVYGRRPRVVMKSALQLDPSVDVLGNRLPNVFIQHSKIGESLFTEQIERLAAGLDANGALVIFPEGGNWTPGRWRRGIRRLEHAGHPDLAAKAKRMPNLLPPRPGGTLAAIAACPEADVIFVAHSGLDSIVSARDVWRNFPIDQVIKARWWRVPHEAIPRDAPHEDQVQWLYDWWQLIDSWISENRPGGAAVPSEVPSEVPEAESDAAEPVAELTRARCKNSSRGTSSAPARLRHHPDRAYAFSMGTARPAHLESRLELADAGRLARRLVRRAVAAARTEDAPVQRALWQHLGPQAADIPVVRATWPGYDRVNVQVGWDAWLAEPGRSHQLAGITGFHPGHGLADLVQNEQWRGARMGSPARDLLPAGPGGVTLACLQCALGLVADGPGRLALLIQATGPEITVDAACADSGRARQVIDEIRRLSVERNVFRGHVVSFGREVFGRRGQELLSFLERPVVGREQVILPPDLLERIERQVVGVARHVSSLRASGQHLKRGVLLHGPPGTGKTHTIRYLLGQLPGVTVVVLTGAALNHIAAACSVARALPPAMVVVEDVDLIAEQRDSRGGQHPLLFQLLNEMDGLGEDADVTFLLTTNRADLLEPALSQRPGRVDHAAEIPFPDADARRRLLRLYQHDLVLDLTSPAAVIAQTEGVTASFLKELLRRAALYAAEDGAGGPLTVRDAHMNAALDELLDSRNQLTRALLGGRAAPPRPASPHPVTT